MSAEPRVYFQPSTIWNPVGISFLNEMAERGLDAILFQADEFFPNEGNNSLIPVLKNFANHGSVPIIQPKNRLNSDHARRAVEAGAITLGANTEDPISLIDTIREIVKKDHSVDGRKRAISNQLYRHPSESDYWWPSMGIDYRLVFADKGRIPHESVRMYVDKLPVGSPIVINAGHFDNPSMRPDDLSTITFEEGVKLAKYLEAKGHKDIRLSVLINDMYQFDDDKQKARREFDKRKRQYKQTGVHDLFPQEYKSILREYGVDIGRWSSLLHSRTETGALFAAQQAISSERRGDSPFRVDLVTSGNQISYPVEGGAMPITSENGAPICRMIAGTHFNQLEKLGPNVIHLFPIEHECSTTGGLRVATELYGGSAKHALFLYAKPKGNLFVMQSRAI